MRTQIVLGTSASFKAFLSFNRSSVGLEVACFSLMAEGVPV